MINNKPYTTPVWWIAIIIFLKIAFIIFYTLQLLSILIPDDSYSQQIVNRLYINQLISQGVLIVILAAEAITYWRIRWRTIKKGLAGVHIGGLFLAFVVLPLAFMAYNTWLHVNTGDGTYGNKLNKIGAVQTVLMWICIIVGHTCFVMLLIDAFKKRQEPAPGPPAPGSPDILNDYA